MLERGWIEMVKAMAGGTGSDVTLRGELAGSVG
jgi:hypothetical protein